MAEKHKPVVFKNSLGETISNDPIYKAQQTLAAAGVEDATNPPEQPEGTLAANAGPAEDEDIPADEETSTDSTDEDGDRYDSMSGAELKAEAKERNVDISGLKKVGEVRQALRDADAAE